MKKLDGSRNERAVFMLLDKQYNNPRPIVVLPENTLARITEENLAQLDYLRQETAKKG